MTVNTFCIITLIATLIVFISEIDTFNFFAPLLTAASEDNRYSNWNLDDFETNVLYIFPRFSL